LTQNFNQKIVLGATCSILLVAFSSVVRYEHEKKSMVVINAATISRPTQTEPTIALAQYALPTQSTAPAKVIKPLIPTATPRQAITTPTPTLPLSTPTQTAYTPVPVQTIPIPQITPIQASTYMTRNTYIALARSDAIKVGINPNYFVHQIQLESNFNPRAQSRSGATGIAQFMPATASGLGIDPTNPITSLNAASSLMANLSRQFGGDYAKALAAYNLGSRTVKNAELAGGKNWSVQLPVSTQNYIHAIMD
jgi:soluble lytic murein transglycosylase-like protein